MTTPALKEYQRQILQKATESLCNDPLEVRNHTGMTMAIDPKMLPKAKIMMENFAQRLCRYLESEEQLQVYQLTMTLFPLQRGEK